MTTTTLDARSPFASALDGAIETIGAGRSTIASWLGVDSSAISRWVQDDTAPSADHLARLVAILRDCVLPTEPSEATRARAARAEFAKVLATPSSQVSPKSRRMIGSPGQHMLSPLREQFEAALATVPLRAQEEILLRGIEVCARLEESPETDFDVLASARPALAVWHLDRPELARPQPAVEARPEASGESKVETRLDLVLREFLSAAFACGPIARRLAGTPTSAEARLETLFKLDDCSGLAQAIKRDVFHDEVLRLIGHQGQRSAEFRPLVQKRVVILIRAFAPWAALEAQVEQALRVAAVSRSTFGVAHSARDEALGDVVSRHSVRLLAHLDPTVREAPMWCREPSASALADFAFRTHRSLVSPEGKLPREPERKEPEDALLGHLRSAEVVRAAAREVVQRRGWEDVFRELSASGSRVVEDIVEATGGVVDEELLIEEVTEALRPHITRTEVDLHSAG